MATEPTTTVYELTQFAVKLAITLPLPMPLSRAVDKGDSSLSTNSNKPVKAPAGSHRKRDRIVHNECAYCRTKFPSAPATRFDHPESECRTKEADRANSSTAARNVDNKTRGCFSCGLPGHMARECPRNADPVKADKEYASIQYVSVHDSMQPPHGNGATPVDDFAATIFLNSLEIPPILATDPADSAAPDFDAGSATGDKQSHEGLDRVNDAPSEPLCHDITHAETSLDAGGTNRRNAFSQTKICWADMPIPEMAVGNNHDHMAEILQINALLADTSIGSSPTTRTIDPVTGRELRPPILTKMLVGSAWATVQIDNGATISILGENLAKLVGVATTSSSRFARGYGRNKTPERLAATVPQVVLQHGSTAVTSRLYVGPLHDGVDLLLGRDLLHEFGIGTFGTATMDSATHIADELAMANIAKKSSIAIASESDDEHNNMLSQQLAAEIAQNKSISPSSYIEHDSATTAIPTDGVPFFRRSYPVKEATRKGTDAVIADWERTGVIFRRTTPTAYGSPLVIVPKRDSSGNLTGKLRVCIDARQINAHYPIHAHVDNLLTPRIDDILDFASGSKLLSTLDVSQAFLQVRLDGASRELTTFSWNSVEYSFNRLPFGTKHASSTCQRVMASILCGLEDICQIYCDDIVIRGGSTLEEHGERVRRVLDRLNAHKVRLSWPKCSMGLSRAILLGHEVSEHGIGPNMARCTAWLNAPEPTTVREVVSLIGFAGFYRRNIPCFARYEAALGRVRLGRPWQERPSSSRKTRAQRGTALSTPSTRPRLSPATRPTTVRLRSTLMRPLPASEPSPFSAHRTAPSTHWALPPGYCREQKAAGASTSSRRRRSSLASASLSTSSADRRQPCTRTTGRSRTSSPRRT